MQKKGNKYGTHRVIEPKGVLTQAAYKIDNNMDEIYSNEILCNVTALNVDSASFTQIADVCGHDDQKIGEMIQSIVAERGMEQVSDTAAIEAVVDAVLAANPDKVAQYQGGKTGLIGFFVGQCMKEMRGQGNPKVINELLVRQLNS